MADLNLNNYTGVIGDFYNPYQQEGIDTCAIKSQQIIMKDFGLDVSEQQLVDYSADKGWYTEGGTAPADVGRLLVDAGIPCTQSIGATKYDLINELAQGHKVIVGVDSGELWDNGILDWLKDLVGMETPDHALIVAGIDTTDPDNPMVILTDPGTGDAAKPYPLDQFMDAWADSQNFMVATDVPTPQSVADFTQAGMTDMHLPEVAGVDFNTLQDFSQYSHMIDPVQLPDLWQAFTNYPDMAVPDFSGAIANYNLPPVDTTLFDTYTPFDPTAFNYDLFSGPNFNTSFDSPSANDLMIDQQTIDKLTDLHDDAIAHYQDCMDNGMYISAQMWQHQAQDCQNDINDIMAHDA